MYRWLRLPLVAGLKQHSPDQADNAVVVGKMPTTSARRLACTCSSTLRVETPLRQGLPGFAALVAASAGGHPAPGKKRRKISTAIFTQIAPQNYTTCADATHNIRRAGRRSHETKQKTCQSKPGHKFTRTSVEQYAPTTNSTVLAIAQSIEAKIAGAWEEGTFTDWDSADRRACSYG